jgi:hypothetical protein
MVLLALVAVLVILRVAAMPSGEPLTGPAKPVGISSSSTKKPESPPTQAIVEPAANKPVGAVWMEGFLQVGDVSPDAPYHTFYYCNGPAAHRVFYVADEQLYEDEQRRSASPDLHPTLHRLRDALDQVVEIWESHDFGTCRPRLRCDVELHDLPWTHARLAMMEQDDGVELDGIRLYGEVDVLLSPLNEEHGEVNEVCRVTPWNEG